MDAVFHVVLQGDSPLWKGFIPNRGDSDDQFGLVSADIWSKFGSIYHSFAWDLLPRVFDSRTSDDVLLKQCFSK